MARLLNIGTGVTLKLTFETTTMYHQRTIEESVDCVGIGLHTGKKVTLRIRPASIDTGIVFIRTDLAEKPAIKATVENVVDTSYATTIGIGNVRVSTIEHLMASFAGLGIDNAIVEVDAPEIPIMDGSAAPFVFLLKNAGIRIQDASKAFIVIKKAIKVESADGYAALLPSRELKLSCAIDFGHAILKKQSLKFKFSDTMFEKELSRARTFCFLKEVDALREQGLAKGGSLDSAIVIDDFRVINEEGLRYENEFVRHKALDALGDISLLGMPVIGNLDTYKSGHSLNHLLTKEVLANPKSWKKIQPEKGAFERLNLKLPSLQSLEPASTY